MKKLTTIELKIKTGKPLDKGDLIFLYEVDGPIEGFGYQRDPRISELRDRRDRRADLATIFDYTPEQIAFSEDEVNERSKAYVGPIFPGVFSYENLEQVYTKFPEWKRGIYKIRIGDKTPQELESIVSCSNNAGGRTALSMLKSEEFASANRDVRDIDVVIVTRKDLGFTKEPREKRDSPSLNEVYQRAAIFGLEPCPATTAPYLAIALSAKSESYRDYGDVISVASDHWIMSEKIGIDGKRDKLPSPLQFYIGPGGMSAGGPTFPTERGLALGHFAFQRKKTEAGISAIAEQKPPGIPEIIVEYFQKKLESKYGPLERDEKDRIGDYLFKLNKTFGGLEELGSERIGERGKRILDIGCGSTLSKYAKELPTSDSERIRSRQYEPWLPRILKELDADPVGIDIGNLEGEQFEYYQLDLTQPGVLDFLPDHSFYAINMWGFLDSPVLRLSRERKKQLLEELEQQKKRLLKEGGRTILWDVEY